MCRAIYIGVRVQGLGFGELGFGIWDLKLHKASVLRVRTQCSGGFGFVDLELLVLRPPIPNSSSMQPADPFLLSFPSYGHIAPEDLRLTNPASLMVQLTKMQVLIANMETFLEQPLPPVEINTSPSCCPLGCGSLTYSLTCQPSTRL